MTTDKFLCPDCGAWQSFVVRSLPDTDGTRYLRWRHCARCHRVFETAEAVTGRELPVHATPAAAPTGHS